MPKEENVMKVSALGIIGVAAAAMLVGCAGQTEQLTMQQAPPPAGQPAKPAPPQQVVFPNGTVFGGA